MLTFTKNTTMSDIADNINDWLKTRRKLADYMMELPTKMQFCEFVDKVIASMLESDLRKDVMQQHREHVEKGYAQKDNADIWGITFIDRDFHASSSGLMLRILSWTDNETNRGGWEPQEEVLTTFSIEIRHMEAEAPEDKDTDTVWSVKATEPTKTVLYLMTHALNTQDKRHLSIQERWMRLPSRVQRAHPICPGCGCSNMFLGGTRGELGKRDDPRILCNECDWVSSRKLYYLSELADDDNFKTEFIRYTKAQKVTEELEEAVTALNMAVERFCIVCKRHEKATSKSYQLTNLVSSAASSEAMKLGKQAEKTTAEFNNRNRVQY